MLRQAAHTPAHPESGRNDTVRQRRPDLKRITETREYDRRYAVEPDSTAKFQALSGVRMAYFRYSGIKTVNPRQDVP